MSTQSLTTALLTDHICDNCEHKTLMVYYAESKEYWESTSNTIARCSLKLKQGTNKYKICPKINTCKKWSPIIER